MKRLTRYDLRNLLLTGTSKQFSLGRRFCFSRLVVFGSLLVFRNILQNGAPHVNNQAKQFGKLFWYEVSDGAGKQTYTARVRRQETVVRPFEIQTYISLLSSRDVQYPLSLLPSK